jgi:hypothetical protein
MLFPAASRYSVIPLLSSRYFRKIIENRACVSTPFSFPQTCTRVYITRCKHGKCFLFLNENLRNPNPWNQNLDSQMERDLGVQYLYVFLICRFIMITPTNQIKSFKNVLHNLSLIIRQRLLLLKWSDWIWIWQNYFISIICCKHWLYNRHLDIQHLGSYKL